MPITLPTLAQTTWGTVLNTAVQAAYDAATTAVSATSLSISGVSTLTGAVTTTGSVAVGGALTAAGAITSGTDVTAKAIVNVGDGTTSSTLNLTASVSNQVATVWSVGGTTWWQDYAPFNGSGVRYFRDMQNTRAQMTFTPGATATTSATDFNTNVVVAGNLSVTGASTLTGTVTASGALSAATSVTTTTAILSCPASVGGTHYQADQLWNVGGVTQWQQHLQSNGLGVMYMQDAQNGYRAHVTYTPGATATTSTTAFGTNVTAAGNLAVTGTSAFTGVTVATGSMVSATAAKGLVLKDAAAHYWRLTVDTAGAVTTTDLGTTQPTT